METVRFHADGEGLTAPGTRRKNREHATAGRRKAAPVRRPSATRVALDHHTRSRAVRWQVFGLVGSTPRPFGRATY